jgi:hypothetical protein
VANSLDASSDRDFVLEFAFALASVAVHLSGWAEEWILWSTTEFGFLQLPQEFCTGSSIMPQKINPDVLELIRGKSARVIGNLTSLLVLVKGLPLAYNRFGVSGTGRTDRGRRGPQPARDRRAPAPRLSGCDHAHGTPDQERRSAASGP